MYRLSLSSSGRSRTPRHSRTARGLIGSSHSSAAAYMANWPHAIPPVPHNQTASGSTATPSWRSIHSACGFHSRPLLRSPLSLPPPVRSTAGALPLLRLHSTLSDPPSSRADLSAWSLPPDATPPSSAWELEEEAQEFEPEYDPSDSSLSPYLVRHQRLRQLTSQLTAAAAEGDWRGAEGMVSEWHDAGMQMDTSAFNAWISCYVNGGEWRGAEAAWARLAQLVIVPDASSYLALMRVYMTDGRPEQLDKIETLYEEMVSGRAPGAQGRALYFSQSGWEHLIQGAHRHRLREEVVKWAVRAQEAGAWAGFEGRYDAVLQQAQHALVEERRSKLKSLAHLGDSDGADRVVAATLASGSLLNIATFNLWLSCYKRRGQWRHAELAWALLPRLQLQPDADTYCTLMCVLLSDGGEEPVSKIAPLYAQMGDTNGADGWPLTFTPRHFEQLIQLASQRSLFAQVRLWADRARETGALEQLSQPCWRTIDEAAQHEEQQLYSRLTRRLIDLSDAPGDNGAAADQAVSEAEATGLRLDVKIFNLWLVCFHRSGGWQGAETVWKRMGQEGVVPDSTSFRRLIEIYINNGETQQLDKIEPLYAQMCSGSGPDGLPLHFSVRDFEQLLKTAHRCRLGGEARKWGDRARAAGLLEQLDQPTRRILATVNKWEHESRTSRQEALKKRLLYLARQGDSAAADQLMAEAEASGVQLDAKVTCAWLGCYISGGEWRGAEAVWKRMAELAIVPHPTSYCQLMQVYMASGQVQQLAKIDQLYKEMQNGSGPAGQPLHFSVRDFEQLIKTAYRSRLGDEARKWGDRARAAGVVEQLDDLCRNILAGVDQWEHLPRRRPRPEPTVPAPTPGSAHTDHPKEAQLLPAQAAHSDHNDHTPVASQTRPSDLYLDDLASDMDLHSSFVSSSSSSRDLDAHVEYDESDQVEIEWKAQLQSHAATGDADAAEQVVSAAEAAGATIDLEAFNTWIGSYERRGEWRAAEAAWGRMDELNLAPDAASYRALMQVYMADGDAEQLAKIDALFASFTASAANSDSGAIDGDGHVDADGAPVRFHVSDYESLIHTAHRCRLGEEARLWAARAHHAGLWDQLDESTRDTVAFVSQWELEARLDVDMIERDQWAAMLEQAGETSPSAAADPAGSSARHAALAAACAADEALGAAAHALEQARVAALHWRQLRLDAFDSSPSDAEADVDATTGRPQLPPLRILRPESDAQRMQRHVAHAAAADTATQADEKARRAMQLYARASKLLANASGAAAPRAAALRAATAM